MNVTYIRYHFILQLKSININLIFMFVKRWTKIKDNPKQVPRKGLPRLSSRGLYMSDIAEKDLHRSIFTSIWRDCLVGIFTVPWVRASGHSGLKCLKNATEVSRAGKSDLMVILELEWSAGFIILKALHEFVCLLWSVTCCAETQESEVCAANQTGPTRYLKCDIQVIPALEVCIRA